jgi:nucleotide-binding universal stress UspA family protein
MASDDELTGDVIVWFEDTPEGRAALLHAQHLSRATDARLTVLAVATHERVVGCGRCLQGTVLWNIEMKKIAHEELCEAREILGPATPASYKLVVGRPADSISAAAAGKHADTVVLPWQRNRVLDPPQRRNVGRKVEANGPWKVIVAPRPAAKPGPAKDPGSYSADEVVAA